MFIQRITLWVSSGRPPISRGGTISVTNKELSYGCPLGCATKLAQAWCDLWNSIKRLKSTSTITSPQSNKKSSVSCGILNNAPAVPKGWSSIKYSILTPNLLPSPK